VFVENRPGAAGILAMTDFKKSPPDGSSYIFAEVGILAINPSYYKSLPYDPEKDLQPVIDLTSNPWVLFTAKDGPVKSMRGLIELAKANPGKFTYGSPGAGTASFGALELLRLRAGIDLLHVPFKEIPQLLAALARGEITIYFSSPTSTRGVKDRVIALGVASKRRYPEFPDIPTIEEAGGPPGFEVTAWGV
jgi:tripartite-type tricarboxylate transporter receptor subunit TctC